MSASKGIIPQVAPRNGKWHCGECGKPWNSVQAYSMHWYRTHGGVITPPRNTRAYSKRKKTKETYPSSSPEYRRQKYLEKKAAMAKVSTNGSGTPTFLLEECPCCHLPLGPIIEGIKRALEERMKRHANES